MSALAGYWPFSALDDATIICGNILAAQLKYGSDKRAVKQCGPLTLGRNLFLLLPEDDWDVQPLSGAGGRCMLVADVRLDNRAELSAKLGLAAADTRHISDSGYLLKALERWGERAPEHLLGDFAFAWFDQAEGHLLLARDPLGQRPLFWHRGRDFIAFASMPKGLHAIDRIARKPNSDAVARFLADSDPLPSESYFSGIERIPPGHIVTITLTGESTRRYWKPEPRTLAFKNFDDYVDAYRAELDRAVNVRLRTRKPSIAVHLSGGWDSGAVAATAALLSPGRVIAFTATPASGTATASPPNRFSDEWPLAAAVAALHPSLEHYRVENDLSSPLDSLERGVSYFERPLFNLCNHGWLAQIREAARAKGAQVLLSGEIGNWSISAGPIDLLNQYRKEYGWQAWWCAARGLTVRSEARWRGVLAASFSDLLPSAVWHSLAPLSSERSSEPAIRLDVMKRLRRSDSDCPLDHVSRTIEAYSHMDFGEFRKGILGGWGIDKRDPTADVRLIEFCLSLPTEMLLNAKARRPLARAGLSDRLPSAVLNATGKGYQSAQWYLSLTRDRKNVEALLERIAKDPVAAAVIDVERLKSIVESWPSTGWQLASTIAIFRNTLLQALTAGHFLIRASETLAAEPATLPVSSSLTGLRPPAP